MEHILVSTVEIFCQFLFQLKITFSSRRCRPDFADALWPGLWKWFLNASLQSLIPQVLPVVDLILWKIHTFTENRFIVFIVEVSKRLRCIWSFYNFQQSNQSSINYSERGNVSTNRHTEISQVPRFSICELCKFMVSLIVYTHLILFKSMFILVQIQYQIAQRTIKHLPRSFSKRR